MYEWNKPFQMVMDIKYEYLNKFGSSDLYDSYLYYDEFGNKKILKAFEKWIYLLGVERFNDFIEPLQVNQHNDFILIRYGLAEMQRGMWEDEDSIYRQCRSLVIDIKNEHIVTSPFRKFFNLNEVKENELDNIIHEIKNASVVEFSDKLDGSMQVARCYEDKIFMTGSMALNPCDSWRLSDGYDMLSQSYINMIKSFPSMTFIFEFISVKDAHVVRYSKRDEGLYLLGMIEIHTGEELSYDRVVATADEFGVKSTKLENVDLDEILKLSKILSSDEKEGWVMSIDGRKVKIKCDDYIQLHRILDKISSINLIIQSIADDKYDDLISKIPDSYRHRVANVSNIIFDYISSTEAEINKHYLEAPKNSKKDFMVYVNNNVDKKIQQYVRLKYYEIEYNVLRNNLGKYKKIKEIVGNDFAYSALFGGD